MFELNNTNPNQSLTISANPASTNILTSQVMPAVYQDLQRFASDPKLNEKLKLTFGSDYNVQTAQTILDNWLIGDFSTLPPIELVERGDIAGANGAFAAATNKIYLSKDILTGDITNTEAIKDVLLEEIGHSIDAQVNAVDAAGDEGAIFATTVQGKVLTSEELSALKAEDDSAVVIMGGKPIVIEQNTMSNPETINNATGYFTGRQLYSSQSVSTNNDKYYRFTIGESAGRLSVGLKDMSGSADVSLIRDANNNGRVDSGEVLGSSEGSSNKLISGNLLDNLSAGTYYLRVKGNASYGIAVNLDQAGNSASEGNTGGFSINKARNLGTLTDRAALEDYQFSDFVGSGLGDSDDFYSFQLDKPRSLSFALRNMTGNANVYIEDGKGTVLAKSENGGSADELSSVNLAGKTTYYVHVAPFGSESTNYRLVLNPGQVIPQSNPSIMVKFGDLRESDRNLPGTNFPEKGFGSKFATSKFSANPNRWSGDSGQQSRYIADADMPVVADSRYRSPQQIIEALEYFNVEDLKNLRYKPGQNIDTHCDLFAGDVMRALRAPLPQWDGLQELSAAGMYSWLNEPKNGWKQVTSADAVAAAKRGIPAVVSHPTHIAVVRPPESGDDPNNPRIAQAGAINSKNTLVKTTFGTRKVLYFIYEG